MPAWATRGQPVALSAVAGAVVTERPAHAWLLVGPAGVGKTTIALDLAAGLLCLAEEPGDRPCGSCRPCRLVAAGTHPDVHRLAPGGAGRQIRIGDRDDPDPGTARRLLRDLSLSPSEGRFRVAIVEEAERMNEDAQNALLKMLEEPPPRTCIVLCAADEEPLLPTVRSRSIRVRLGPVADEQVATLLVERGLADPVQASSLARRAEGRPGRAFALARDPEAPILQDRLARELLDLSSLDRRARLAAAGGLLADAGRLGELIQPDSLAGTPSDDVEEAPADVADAPRTGEPSRRAGLPPSARRRAFLELAGIWAILARDLAVAAIGGRAELRRLDLLEEIVALADRLPTAGVERFRHRLDAAAIAVDQNANPELALDALLLAWPAPAGLAGERDAPSGATA